MVHSFHSLHFCREGTFHIDEQSGFLGRAYQIALEQGLSFEFLTS